MADAQDALAGMQNWARQTVLNTMSQRALDLGKDMGDEKLLRSVAAEMNDVCKALWDETIQSLPPNPPAHDVLNPFVRKILDWCFKHLYSE